MLQHNGEVCREKLTCKCQWQPPSPRVYIPGAQIDTPCAQLPHINAAQPCQNTLVQEVYTIQDWCRQMQQSCTGDDQSSHSLSGNPDILNAELGAEHANIEDASQGSRMQLETLQCLPENPLYPSFSSHTLRFPKGIVLLELHWLHTSA